MESKRLDIRQLLDFEEKQGKIILWLKENRKALLIGATLILLLAILFFSLGFQDKGDWGKARSEVEKDLLRLEKLELGDRGELLALAKSIEGHFVISPEFPPLYEGRLSQALIQNGAVEEAERLLKGQEMRLASPLPQPFKTFSDSSILIAKGEFEKAWSRELELKKELIGFVDERGKEKWIDTLSAFNLVRRAILADLLHKNGEADQLKKEIFSLLKNNDNPSQKEALESLVEAYKIGPKNLLTYLDREIDLSLRLASEGSSDL